MASPDLIDISAVLNRARAFLASLPAETDPMNQVHTDTDIFEISASEDRSADQGELYCLQAMQLAQPSHAPDQPKPVTAVVDVDGESDSEDDLEDEKEEKTMPESGLVYIPPDQTDLVITVNVSVTTSRNTSSQPVQLQFLSSQPLSALLPKLHCPTEWAVEKIISPAAKNPLDAFFLIENCFYDDEVHPGKRPSDKYFYALLRAKQETVETFLPNLARGGNFKRASLLQTCWQDLKIRMNQPYLLVHYGFCQHQVTVTDIRLHSAKIDPPPASFPRILSAPRTRHRRCRACECYYATHMTVDDKLAPENPCYWCDKCFKDFHQRPDSDEYWYTDFKHFPYTKDT